VVGEEKETEDAVEGGNGTTEYDLLLLMI